METDTFNLLIYCKSIDSGSFQVYFWREDIWRVIQNVKQSIDNTKDIVSSYPQRK